MSELVSSLLGVLDIFPIQCGVKACLFRHFGGLFNERKIFVKTTIMIHTQWLFFHSILLLMKATSRCLEIRISLSYDWREHFRSVFPGFGHLRFKDLAGWKILLSYCAQ